MALADSEQMLRKLVFIKHVIGIFVASSGLLIKADGKCPMCLLLAPLNPPVGNCSHGPLSVESISHVFTWKPEWLSKQVSCVCVYVCVSFLLF